MLKCDSSKCWGTLFMTVRGNNSSLPANFHILEGLEEPVPKLISAFGFPYHQAPPPLVCNSCYKIVIRTFHCIFSSNLARGDGLLWNEMCLWNILHLYSILFCLEQRCLFMNKAFLGCLSTEFSTASQHSLHAESLRATEASLCVWQQI